MFIYFFISLVSVSYTYTYTYAYAYAYTCKGFTASGSLDPDKQRHELTKGLCGTRLADSAKTELLWISLMKPGASALLSKLRQPFTQEKLGITTKRLKVYLPRMFEICNEEFLKI